MASKGLAAPVLMGFFVPRRSPSLVPLELHPRRGILSTSERMS